MTDPNSGTPAPLVGAISVSGRRPSMEDAISVRPNLCSPYLNLYRPIDFFAVYDGHGGPHVAGLCRDRMHILLQQELMIIRTNLDMSCGSSNDDMGFLRRQERLESHRLEETWKRVLTRCFQRIDEMAFDTCYECGIGTQCGCPSYTLGMGGSTALLVILTEETIIVANCGNSRAVLSRGGEAISLSIDHKPDRQDERARIEACGGQVLFGGCARVQGILAISRAIGDKYLKKYITSEPEFTFIKRQWEDELLIIASDGLWDVVSNEMACRVAREFLHEENLGGNPSSRPSTSTTALPSSPSATAAASLLAQLALEQNSPDNISVIVVDLKKNSTRL